MVFRRRSPLGKRAPRRKYARKPRRAVGARKSMVKLIKSVIHKQAENKQVSFTTSNSLGNVISASTLWEAQNIVPLSPTAGYMAMTQGPGQGNRVGNKVRTVRCHIKFIMSPRAIDVTTNQNPIPQDVRILIMKSKDTPTTKMSFTELNGGIFQNGNSDSGFSGQLPDLIRDINKDLYTVYYDKLFKVGPSSVYSTVSDNGKNSFYFANNDYKSNLILKIDVTKWVGKQLTFNDNTSLCETPMLQMVILPCACDGQNNAFCSVPLYWTYQQVYEYEDM